MNRRNLLKTAICSIMGLFGFSKSQASQNMIQRSLSDIEADRYKTLSDLIEEERYKILREFLNQVKSKSWKNLSDLDFTYFDKFIPEKCDLLTVRYDFTAKDNCCMLLSVPRNSVAGIEVKISKNDLDYLNRTSDIVVRHFIQTPCLDDVIILKSLFFDT